MLRRCLPYLMIALIALQPVVSIADTHQFQHSGTEHLAFEHDHSDKQPLVKAGSYAPDTVPEPAHSGQTDCQDCCHCHGTGQVILALSQVISFNNQISKITSLYRLAYLSYSTTPDKPPPIS
jgi:hypothetical protein